MDDIKQRLHDTSEHCYKSYEAWAKDEKSKPAREELQMAIHELRKVASRLEIELAVSESANSSKSKIDIPHHRDSKKRQGGDKPEKGNKKSNDDNGNKNTDKKAAVKNSLKPKKKAAEG